MSFEESELRRALAARSADPTPEFRARVVAALEADRPRRLDLRGALAVVAAGLMAVAVIGALLTLGGHRPDRGTPAVPGPTSSSSPTAPEPPSPPTTSTPTPSATAAPQAPLVIPAIPKPTSTQLSAAPGGVLWALVAGQYLFRSVDRGETWELRSLPASHGVAEISFVDASHGWALGPASAAVMCTSQAAPIWSTADGGTTWTQLPATGISLSGCKSGLSFADPNRGFLGSWDDLNAPVLYRTLDGGRSWARSRPLPDPPGFSTQSGGHTLRIVAVHAPGSNLLLQAWNNQGQNYVFRSGDGGASWTYAATLPGTGASTAFLSLTHWFQLGPGDSVETTDAGASWHPVASDYQQAAPVPPALVFGDAATAYATVRGGIQRSLDGGAHWTPVREPW